MDFALVDDEPFSPSCSTLIMPALLSGNVGQLAIDLLVSSARARQVAHLDEPSVLPYVSNDAFGPDAVGDLALALEAYESPSHRLAFIQQRSPVIILFVIEGNFIHLREGAQQIISATTAAAKIAAAAAASSAPYSSLLPSVVVTPVAQSIRQKRGPVVDSRSSNTMPSGNGFTTANFGDQFEKCSHIPKASDQHQSFRNYS